MCVRVSVFVCASAALHACMHVCNFVLCTLVLPHMMPCAVDDQLFGRSISQC